MLWLIVRALLGRGAPAITLLLLSILSAGAAAAAPQYIARSAQDMASPAVAAASVEDRTFAAELRLDGGALTADRVAAAVEEVRTAVALPDLTVISGLVASGAVSGAERGVTAPLGYRDGFCDQLVLDGRCPARAGEVAVAAATAQTLGVRVGDPVRFRAESGRSDVPLTVVAIYRAKDLYADYWAARELVRTGTDDDETATDDRAAVFTVPETITRNGLPTAFVEVDGIGAGDILATTAPLDVRDRLREAQAQLVDRGYETDAQLSVLAADTHNAQLDVVRGVPVSVAELLAVCWIALFLAVRHGGAVRRREVGLLKLRGAGRWRMLALSVGQSAVPMIVGGVVGVVVGLALVRPRADVLSPQTARIADLGSLGAAAVAVLGSLLAATVAERRTLRAPVAVLLRSVPARRFGWRSGTIDAVLVVLALAGAYEARAYAASSAQASWLALLSPALLALALGVVLARLLVPLAARVGRQALRAGRIGAAVTAIELARRPSVPQLTALLTTAVALLGTALATADTTSRADRDRAAAEVGADRVLIVTAPSRSQLLSAVRSIDPGGRAAMAVVASPNNGVLAVDATRLAAVARWRGEYGAREAAAVAARLRPAQLPSEPTVAGPAVTLEAGGEGRPVTVRAAFAAPDGSPVDVTFGPVTGPRRAYRQDVAACAGACRLVSLTIGPRSAAFTLRIFALAGTAGGVDPAVLADRTRWRTATAVGQLPLDVSTDQDGLTLSGLVNTVDRAVYVADTPDRLPMVAAGGRGPELSAADPQLGTFPGPKLPVTLAGGASALPRLGREGALVDLETADRMAGDLGIGDSMQVWLTADAPADMTRRLAERGIVTVRDNTTAALADRYARQALPVTVRFQLLAGMVIVLLAAGALGVVAAVERRPRGAALIALRRQGLTAGAAGRASLGTYAVVIGLAVVAGVVTTVVARTVLRVGTPLLPDVWQVLTAPAAARAAPIALAAVGSAVVFAAVVAMSTGRLLGQVRRLDEETGP
ncbi:MAG TPA: FtsX-like permease family protein [Asanoa sp.]